MQAPYQLSQAPGRAVLGHLAKDIENSSG